MRTLILSMPRSQSTRVFHCFANTNKYQAQFSEPGATDSRLRHRMTAQEILNKSQRDYHAVTSALLSSTLGVLVKVVPEYPWSPLDAKDAATWLRYFDEVVFLHRDFKALAVSFFVAWKSQQWNRKEGTTGAVQRVAYDPSTDAHCLSKTLVNFNAFRHWNLLFQNARRVTHVHTEVDGEVDRFLASRDLHQSTFVPQYEVPYSEVVTNYSELEADIALAERFANLDL